MICAWDALLGIIPPRMRDQVDEIGRYTLQEFRMRQGLPPELILKDQGCWLEGGCTKEDISFCIQRASRYSPWAAESIRSGYLTAPGGHRIGLCGLALYRGGIMTGIRQITSVCIRIARDYHGIAEHIPKNGSTLILGAPGWGKTTLLRDLIRLRSDMHSISVVDERGELFPEGFDRGKRVDVLLGSGKKEGIEQVLKTMGPSCIAIDEITGEKDCNGILRAAGCGVQLLATAHAATMDEFLSRPVYKILADKHIFDTIVLMTPDQKYTIERIKL